jgi:hypothetical protein
VNDVIPLSVAARHMTHNRVEGGLCFRVGDPLIPNGVEKVDLVARLQGSGDRKPGGAINLHTCGRAWSSAMANTGYSGLRAAAAAAFTVHLGQQRPAKSL